MKLNIDKASLHAALTVAASATEKRSPTPTLQCVHLRTDGDHLIISGTDTKVASSHTLECNIEEAGSVGVDAADIVRMVGAMPDGGVTLTVTDGSKLKITGATKRKFDLYGIPGAEMATLGNPPEASGWVSGVDLTAALETVRHAVHTDSDRPALHMARVWWKDGALRAIATDSHRGAKFYRECDGEPFDAVVSGRAIPLALAFAEDRGRIDVASDSGSLYLLAGGDWQRYSVPSDAMPLATLERVLDQQYIGAVKVDAVELSKAIRAIGVAQVEAAGDRTGREGLFLDIFPDRIRVQFERASDEIPCEATTEYTTCLEAGYLLDALKVCGHETTLKPGGGDLDPLGFESGNASGLVMPMRK